MDVGSKVADLHGHIFKVTDYRILPKETRIIYDISEHASLHNNRLDPSFNTFILIHYKDKWAALDYYDDYLIVWILKFIEYKPENDLRWEKER